DPQELKDSHDIFEHTTIFDSVKEHEHEHEHEPQQDMMMEHPQQPLVLHQFKQPSSQDPPISLDAMPMESVHPFHTSMSSISSSNPGMESLPMSHATSRPLWLENKGLTHRASFHNVLSMGKDERLRPRQDRGSIISLSSVGDDSPSEFTSFDLEHSGLGYDPEEYDHHSIGTGLAMMSFLDYQPQSHSSPGDSSLDGDVHSAHVSRSNSVMIDPASIAMFNLGEDPLHLQADGSYSKDIAQQQQQHPHHQSNHSQADT
ncbi:hypothetical protein BGZ82_004103, partial [Podila clonocystis]